MSCCNFLKTPKSRLKRLEWTGCTGWFVVVTVLTISHGQPGKCKSAIVTECEACCAAGLQELTIFMMFFS